MDEAAYVDRDTFYKVIVPVIHVKYTVLICISSPSDDNNWFSRIMSYKDEEGKPLVFSHKFTHVCRKCAKKSPAMWKLCTHTKGMDPAFKSKQSKEKWGKISELEGNLDTHLREDWGIITTSHEPCFPRERIEYIFNKANFYNPPKYDAVRSKYIHCLFACIDPNGGGMNNSAIVIGYRDMLENKVIVSSTHTQTTTTTK